MANVLGDKGSRDVVSDTKMNESERDKHPTLGVGNTGKQARLNPRQRYNRWADATIAGQATEIERLKDRLKFEMQPEAKEGI